MKSVRTSSLDPLQFTDWEWQYFLDTTIKALSESDVEDFSMPNLFLDRTSEVKKGNYQDQIKLSTWACKTEKLRQVRAACLFGGQSLSVFNLVFSPSIQYDMPFFGADFVCLPSGYLLALDFQPVLKYDKEHTELLWKRLIPLHKKWQAEFPDGGSIPESAKDFFSPAFLWTRLPHGDISRKLISNVLRPAFYDYLELYLELLAVAPKVDLERSCLLQKGQIKYVTYRAQQDPARPMLSRFYGKDWAQSYIHKILFDVTSI